jgi:FAD:protein FMN transferase
LPPWFRLHRPRLSFDPCIGATLEQLGFSTNYRTGQAVRSGVVARATFRDVRVDRRDRTLLLQQPMVLDLNAVAKGLAIDLAVRELDAYRDLCLEAGGDIFVRGTNSVGEPWHVGIQHPRVDGQLACTFRLSDTAVCTSGDYERRSPRSEKLTHILDARTRQPVADLASVTVIAPTAMAADGLSTAAMVMGHERGRRFLRQQGVRSLLVSPDGELTKIEKIEL